LRLQSQYLTHTSAGVALEESGEKWRAGDSAKAARFFGKAIDMYDAGLQRWKDNADLAYNKYAGHARGSSYFWANLTGEQSTASVRVRAATEIKEAGWKESA
jgi:hypothetical protein